jgi:hypothetical protein
MDVVAIALGLIAIARGMWKIVPTKMTRAEAFFASQICGGIGALIWVAVLRKLKQWGLEPESTDPFGGDANEARLVGGLCLGFVYFLPLAVWFIRVDTKFHNDAWWIAILSNTAFAIGSAVGAGIFYGAPIRKFVTSLRWSHLLQESVLVLIWSGLILGIAFSLYAALNGALSKTPVWVALTKALIGTLISMLFCLLTVMIFVTCCATSDQPRQGIRGVFVGIIVMWSITQTHETIRGSAADLLRSISSRFRRV